MLTYVRWYWPADDRWNYDELGADRWALRHVSLPSEEFERLWRDARRQLEQQTAPDSSVRAER
jgi:hypothetical protein